MTHRFELGSGEVTGYIGFLTLERTEKEGNVKSILREGKERETFEKRKQRKRHRHKSGDTKNKRKGQEPAWIKD